ncbi:MAG: 16S rRNA (guanine(527)-N(7))-methyltransferase RsmG [Flexilinea sp.]
MENWIEYARTQLGITLSDDQQRMFVTYESELQEWSEKINLTSIRDSEGIRIKHFLDSLTCAQMLGDMNGKSLVDIGTGAGFPGIPLKIIFPAMRLVLVDSTGKKVDFCRRITTILGLKNCTSIQARAEEMGLSKEHREKYDAATARAVAVLPILCEYLLPLVKVGGIMLVQKGESAPDELIKAKHAIYKLGGKSQEMIPVILPTLEDRRYLIPIRKVFPTPPGYPRRTGLPAQKPIL